MSLKILTYIFSLLPVVVLRLRQYPGAKTFYAKLCRCIINRTQCFKANDSTSYLYGYCAVILPVCICRATEKPNIILLPLNDAKYVIMQ